MLSTLLRKPVCIDLTTAREARTAAVNSATSETMLTREQLIDRIISHNTSATVEFLSQFEDSALSKYLDHLSLTSRPRGRESRWTRPDRAPWACVARACA